MGQFLSFSKEHLSTVALVRNLHTGYVSPQYHVVFDYKFETVFSDGKTSDELDKICNELFVNSCDCYAEEEYDEDGVLIYKPPPLDESGYQSRSIVIIMLSWTSSVIVSLAA